MAGVENDKQESVYLSRTRRHYYFTIAPRSRIVVVHCSRRDECRRPTAACTAVKTGHSHPSPTRAWFADGSGTMNWVGL